MGLQQVCAHTLTHSHAYVMMPHKVNYAHTLYTCMHVCIHMFMWPCSTSVQCLEVVSTAPLVVRCTLLFLINSLDGSYYTICKMKGQKPIMFLNLLIHCTSHTEWWQMHSCIHTFLKVGRTKGSGDMWATLQENQIKKWPNFVTTIWYWNFINTWMTVYLNCQ